jgi:hypothetical protein
MTPFRLVHHIERDSESDTCRNTSQIQTLRQLSTELKKPTNGSGELLIYDTYFHDT